MAFPIYWFIKVYLEYCNSLLNALSFFSLFTSISAPTLFTNMILKWKYQHVITVIKIVHWLSTTFRIKSKYHVSSSFLSLSPLQPCVLIILNFFQLSEQNSLMCPCKERFPNRSSLALSSSYCQTNQIRTQPPTISFIMVFLLLLLFFQFFTFTG